MLESSSISRSGLVSLATISGEHDWMAMLAAILDILQTLWILSICINLFLKSQYIPVKVTQKYY